MTHSSLEQGRQVLGYSFIKEEQRLICVGRELENLGKLDIRASEHVAHEVVGFPVHRNTPVVHLQGDPTAASFRALVRHCIWPYTGLRSNVLVKLTTISFELVRCVTLGLSGTAIVASVVFRA
jgi:hypothetical protein